MSSTASLPFDASPTTSTSGHVVSRLTRNFRAGRSSSATTTVSRAVLIRPRAWPQWGRGWWQCY